MNQLWRKMVAGALGALLLGGCSGIFQMRLQALAALNGVLTAPVSALAGSCTAIVVAFNPPTSHATALTGTVSGSAHLFTDAMCTAPLTTLTTGLGTTSLSVYLLDTQLETVHGALTVEGGSASFTMKIAGPDSLHLLIDGPAQLAAGACGTYTVRSEDANHHPATFALSAVLGKSAGGIYHDAACTVATSSASIPVGGGATFYYRNTVAGDVLLKADEASFLAISAELPVSVTGAAPTKIVVRSAPNAIVAGTCNAIGIGFRDAFDNPTAPAGAFTFQVTGQGFGTFFGDAHCQTPSPGWTLSQPQAEPVWYFLDFHVENLVMHFADAAGQLSQAPLSLPVTTPGSPAIFVDSPNSLVDVAVGTCVGPIKIFRSAGSNTVQVPHTFSLNGSGQGAFFSDANCTQVISTINMAAGEYQGTFYARDSTAQDFSFSISDPLGFYASSPTYTFGFLRPAARVVFAIATALVKRCNALSVNVLDDQGQRGLPAAGAALSLSATGSGAFYSDGHCTTPIGTVALPAGTFYFRDPVIESATLSGAASGLVVDSKNVSLVNPYFQRVHQAAVNPDGTAVLSEAAEGDVVLVAVAYTDTGGAVGTVQISDGVNNYSRVAFPSSVIANPNLAGGSTTLQLFIATLASTRTLTLSAGVTGGGSAPSVQLSAVEYAGISGVGVPTGDSGFGTAFSTPPTSTHAFASGFSTSIGAITNLDLVQNNFLRCGIEIGSNYGYLLSADTYGHTPSGSASYTTPTANWLYLIVGLVLL